MQFVNFTQIMSRPIPTSKKEAEFALSALMEIPEQFKAAMSLQLLGYVSCQNHTSFRNFGSSVFFPCSTHLNWFISGFLGSKRRGFPNRPVLPPPVSDRQQYSGCSAVKHTQSTSYGAAPKTPPAPKTPSAPRQDSDIGDPQVLSSDLGTMKHQCGYVMFRTFTPCWTPVPADLSNLLEPSQGPCFWVRPSGTITAWEHSLKFPWRHWSWHQLYTWMSW